MAGSIRTDAYQSLLSALVAERNARKISQANLANLIGKPASYVGKFELGERRLDVVELLVILRALGVDPIAFLQNHVDELPDKL